MPLMGPLVLEHLSSACLCVERLALAVASWHYWEGVDSEKTELQLFWVKCLANRDTQRSFLACWLNREALKSWLRDTALLPCCAAEAIPLHLPFPAAQHETAARGACWVYGKCWEWASARPLAVWPRALLLCRMRPPLPVHLPSSKVGSGREKCQQKCEGLAQLLLCLLLAQKAHDSALIWKG